jgi:hypothetical protein
MKTLKPTEIIKKNDEYWDDVHNVFRIVPSFWVNDCAGTHTHMILRETNRDTINKETCHFN